MQRITERRNKVVITDRMWARLLSSTNQPSFLKVKDTIDDERQELQTQSVNGDGEVEDNIL